MDRPQLLIVPANRGGSIEHFYHFLLGYLLPFLDVCHPLRDHRRFLLRDCGPMQEVLRQMDGFEIDTRPPAMVLGCVVGSVPALAKVPRLTVLGFDDPAAYEAATFRRLRALIPALFGDSLSAAAARHPRAQSNRLVLLVERAPPHPHYLSKQSEAPGGGAQRRSIPNMDALHEAIAARHETLRVRLEELPFFDQVYLFSRAWRVVGQHGAGLAHMLWAREDAALVEAVPTSPGVPVGRVAHAAFFRGICQALGMAWHGVPQLGDHAPVDPARVLHALEADGP